MAAALFRLIPPVAGIVVCIMGIVLDVIWICALVHYDPEECPCDRDCESCPFPSEGCSWKNKEDKNQ